MEKKNYLNEDLLNIIFEGRNQSYGAYVLRQKQEVHLRKAIGIGFLSIFIVVFLPFFYKKYFTKVKIETFEQVTSVEMSDKVFVEEKKIVKIPPASKEPSKAPKKTIIFVAPKVEEDKNVAQETNLPPNDKIQDEISNQKHVISDVIQIPDEGYGEGSKDNALIEEKTIDEVFEPTSIEVLAEFPGGQVELMRWLSQNIKYPAIAREINLQGRVVLKFIVEKDGRVSNVTVLKKVHDLLDTEAVRVIKSMPEWKAGKQGGKNVRCYFTLPVNFRLQ